MTKLKFLSYWYQNDQLIELFHMNYMVSKSDFLCPSYVYKTSKYPRLLYNTSKFVKWKKGVSTSGHMYINVKLWKDKGRMCRVKRKKGVCDINLKWETKKCPLNSFL